MKNYSFEIIEAENGRAGIESAVNLEPDLILLDLNLPDISSFEVLDALKRNPRTMLIPAGVPLNEKRIEKIVEEGYEFIFVRKEEELEEKEEEI